MLQAAIDPRIPSGLPPNREALLRYALAEDGTKERTGKNDGPVEKYMPAWARGKGLPYCGFFGGWNWIQVFGRHPYEKHLGGVWDIMRAAKARGEFHLSRGPNRYSPIPGDAGLIIHDKDGNLDTRDPGHFYLVVRLSEDGKLVNTIEGNFRNRVGCATRSTDDPALAGWVNCFDRMCGEGDAVGWQRGLFDAPHAGGLANTR